MILDLKETAEGMKTNITANGCLKLDMNKRIKEHRHECIGGGE